MVIHWSWFRKEVVFYEREIPQGIWDKLAEKMLIEFAESGCPIFRATTPLSRSQLKSKGHGKLSIHYATVQETIETIFRIIVSANQLSLYGAVAEMCEVYESLHDRSGRPDVVMGQPIVLRAIKTKVLLENDDPAYQNFLLQQYEEHIEKLSQQDRLSGQGDGVPKACSKQAAADSRGSRTCVCANTFSLGCGTRRGGRMN